MAEDSAATEKFRAWSQRKAVRDKALNMIGQLSSSRVEDAGKFREATISICAVDKLLQDSCSGSGEENKRPGAVKEATMKSVWLKWTIERKHKFSRVQLSDQEYHNFSGAVKEYIDVETDPNTDKNVYYLASLQYDIPTEPKPGEKAKSRTPDQVLKCKIYMKESNKFWKSCQLELSKRLTEYLARAATSLGSRGMESKEESKGGESKEGSDFPAGLDSFDFGSNQLRTESTFLSKIGIGQMKRWLEVDQDEAIEKERKEKSEIAEERRKEHESWVKKKDSLRIRLPTTDQLAKVLPKPPSRMGYGGEMSAVRPAHAGGAKSTIEIMARSGLKYIHATSKGKQGAEGDFEAGQKLLRQIKDQEAMLQRQEAESKKRSERAYEQWTLQKDMRDQALKVLPLIELPGVELKTSGPSLSMKASMSKVGGSKALTGASMVGSITGPLRPNDAAVNVCLDVGKALKKVDRALFQEWFKWCGGTINFNHAIALWDFFEPKACDVHSATYSEVRNTFQKLLRPGIDYVQAFESYVEKHKQKVAAIAESKSENPPDIDANKIALNKRDMKKFLRTLGFEMKATELRVLIDAFDANGDGSVSIQEFKEFVGPKREKKGGVSTILGQRCCFQTTCKRTGMANAYSISIIPKKFAEGNTPIAESKDGDDRLDTQDEKEEDRIIIEGVSKTEKVMPNGETRVRVELKERLKREAILQKYGLISSMGKDDSKAESKCAYNDDDCDDGYEDDDEFNDPTDTKSGGNVEQCSFIRWTLDDRKSGLKYIMDLTKESRQEQLIKNLISSGTPPAAPKLWCASPDDPYFRGDENAMTNELLLKWGPDQQADLVSFYSLEFAGAVGSSNAKPQEYREIFRDPTDASPDSEFELSSIVDKLEPGKSYFFRIRGFNGFGPGPFTYKEFSTAPAPPAVPRIIKLSSGSVTLRWTFTPSFFKCLEELKRIFNAADTDGTGTVERDELSAILKEKVPNSGNITSFLKKVQTSAGVSFEYGYDSLFDLIESDDDGHLTWEEFEKFFLNVGWSGGTSVGSVAASRASISGGAGKVSSDGFTYIVEQCSNEFDDKYVEIMKTTAGECTIHRLDAGKSYRFRVFAINSAGVFGAKSESVVVNTMIETPSAPTPINSTSAIGSRVISLTWKARNSFNSTRNEKVQRRMMGEWSGSGGDNEEGVSVEVAFQQYDRDGSGSIDASELALLLQDLGVEATEERLRNAFNEFDKNGDGVISFDEFSEWWKKDEVEYVLKRSEPVFAANDDNEGKIISSAARKTAVTYEACPIVSYRGDRCKCDVMGLEPNRLYYFRLRYLGSRSNSLLSPPLALMTLPLPLPKAPVLIRRNATNVWVKWYSAPGGAYRFIVQLKPENIGSSASVNSSKVGNADKGGWSNVFNGPETSWKSTTMSPGTSYLLRVCGVNCQGAVSEPSPILRFKMLPRGEGSTLTPKTVQSDFRIECTGDICVGDTILVTERLFEKTVNNTTQFIDTTGLTKSSGVAASDGGHKGTTRLDLSVTSIGSAHGGNTQLGAYLGERTICAHVMKDNYRTLKKEERKGNSSSNDIVVGSSKFSKNRRLMLEVVWQRPSTDACRPYDLKPGVTIERHQAHLEQFEVFRCKWEQEEERVPLVVDWDSSSDCYVGLNC